MQVARYALPKLASENFLQRVLSFPVHSGQISMFNVSSSERRRRPLVGKTHV